MKLIKQDVYIKNNGAFASTKFSILKDIYPLTEEEVIALIQMSRGNDIPATSILESLTK